MSARKKDGNPDETGTAENSSPSTADKPQPLKKDAFHIVGIGASAGGLEALEQFFKHMPPDSGLAFAVVQHLDPSRSTSMPEILARFTSMPVHLAAEGMQVEPGSIYLIPPNRNMGIHNGALFLQKPEGRNELRMPVDFFLRSLAQERGARAICIILSGTGTDGTLGLKAVKAQMGVIFVQEPQSAKYDGMPRSAIDTGIVDFVLRPEEMPGRLMHFVRSTALDENEIGFLTEEAGESLQEVFSTLRAKTGHDFSHYKQNTILRRLERRMIVNGMTSLEAYSRFLKDNEPEVKALLKDFLISVTSFFRDPDAFDVLKDRLCGLVKTKTAGSDLRVWVAGCATGEEAYSVAMLILECLDQAEKNLPVQVFATDIDGAALNLARAGIYPANIAADISPERLQRFFVKQADSYLVKKDLRGMVIFAPQNFIKDPPFSRMDLICCRNTLIYLESGLQKKLIPLLHYALRPGGLLFLGTSETVGEAADLFSVLDRKWKVYKRREVIVPSERLRFPSAFAPAKPEEAGGTPIDPMTRVPASTEKLFLDNFAPTFAVIDDKQRLIYVRGRTGKYLEIASGQPTLSILEIAREGLRADLASAIFQATSEKKTIIKEGVRVKHNGGFQNINLTVAPLAERDLPPGLLMIVFQEISMPLNEGKVRQTSRGQKGLAIEEELRLTKGNLQSAVEELEAANEELKSANEELQSNNEELQSSNEELDTSREELQSLNEEMLTVNSELQTKNELLTRANDDLKNYLNRTDIAIIFLDPGFKIRTYTPATADVFNVREIDIGRPLEEITSRLAYEGMMEDARQVFGQLTAKEIEVQRQDGRWFTMRILPYLTVQNALEGLVISFLDIDKQKRAISELASAVEELKGNLEKLKSSEEKYRSLFENITEGFALVEIFLNNNGQPSGFRYLEVNPAWERVMGLSREKAVGRTHQEINPDLDPAMVERYYRAAIAGEPATFEYYSTFLSKWIRVNVFPLPQERLAYTIEDITPRKQAEDDLKNYASELENLNKELDSFAYSISHDLKAPLRSLDGFSQAILEDYGDKVDDKGKEYLRLIRSSSQLMAKLIEDLLGLSRVARAELDVQKLNLSEIAVELAGEIGGTQPERMVEFKITPDMIVNGDRNLLKLVLNNLLANAFKFTSKSPEAVIEFGMKVAQGKQVYFVKDNGVGFEMNYTDRLFKPFQRLHSSADFPGTGIGLAAAQRIISRHGGRIWAEAEKGKGAAFYFTLGDNQKSSPVI